MDLIRSIIALALVIGVVVLPFALKPSAAEDSVATPSSTGTVRATNADEKNGGNGDRAAEDEARKFRYGG